MSPKSKAKALAGELLYICPTHVCPMELWVRMQRIYPYRFRSLNG